MPTILPLGPNDEPNKRNPISGQITYHLHRLKTASDPKRRIEALKGIEEILLGEERKKNHSLTLKTIPQLCDHFNNENEVDKSVKGRILNLIVKFDFDSPETRELFFDNLKVDRSDTSIACSALSALEVLVYRKEDNLSQEEISKLSESLFPMLKSQDGKLIFRAVNLLECMLVNFEEKKSNFLATVLKKEGKWIKVFNDLQTDSFEDRTQRNASRVLDLLANPQEAKKKRESIPTWGELLKEISKRPYDSYLDKTQMALLASQIQEEGSLPWQFLGDLFNSGKQMLFVNYSNDNLDKAIQNGIVSDVCRLKEQDLITHFGLPFHKKQEENLLKFLNGKNPPEFIKEFSKLVSARVRRNFNLEDAKNKLRAHLLDLQSQGLNFLLYGPDENLTGELRFEQVVNSLAKFLKENKNSKTIIYEDMSIVNPFTLIDLNNLGNTYLSYFKALSEVVNPNLLATVIEETEHGWSLSSLEKVSNLEEFLDNNPIPTSFGFTLGQSPIDKLKFYIHIKETYGEAWSGLIFRKDKGEGDPSYFEPPKINRPVPKDSPLILV